MDITNWNGAEGLPPLGDDDRTDEERRGWWRRLLDGARMASGGVQGCTTPGCERLAVMGTSLCMQCNLRELEHEIYADKRAEPEPYPTLPAPVTPETRAERREREAQIRERSAPLLAELDRQSGGLISTALDDQCELCRYILSEHGARLEALNEYAVTTRYRCQPHRRRELAHALLCDHIDDLMRTRPSQRGLTSAQVAALYPYGYLGGIDL